jgi:hypothetical protein
MLNEAADDVVAALLLDKDALAKQGNTELRLSGAPVAVLRISSEDLITVVGNLLDNGVEAAAAQPEPSSPCSPTDAAPCTSPSATAAPRKGLVTLDYRRGATGHPVHLYRWT